MPGAELMAVSMPTSGKAAAAICFAIVGWLMADNYVPGMPDASSDKMLRESATIIGALVGWNVMGNSVGNRYVDAMGYGWKTVIVLVVVAMFAFGLYDMFGRSTAMVYNEPLDAIVDVFVGMLKRGEALLSIDVFTAGFVGGGLAGILAEAANRRWG